MLILNLLIACMPIWIDIGFHRSYNKMHFDSNIYLSLIAQVWFFQMMTLWYHFSLVTLCQIVLVEMTNINSFPCQFYAVCHQPKFNITLWHEFLSWEYGFCWYPWYSWYNCPKHFVLNGIIVIWAKINTSSNDLSCLFPKFLWQWHDIILLLFCTFENIVLFTIPPKIPCCKKVRHKTILHNRNT